MLERMIELLSIDIDHCQAAQTTYQPPSSLSSSSLVSSLLNKHIKADQCTSSLANELTRFQNVCNADENTLSFWKKNESNFPKMAKIAKVILCISMTSAKAESSFSVAGCLQRKARSSITPFRAEKILFIHDNYDLLKFH